MQKDNASYSEENGGTIIFEGAGANLKGGWLELIVQEIQTHSRAMMMMDGSEDGIKAHYAFLKIINILPQKTGKRGTHSRERLYNRHKALLAKRMKEATKELDGSILSDKDKARVRMETELETIGHITDYVQKYIGIEEELTIDHVGAGLGK